METNYLFLQLAARNRDAFLCLHWMIHSDLNKNKNSSEKIRTGLKKQPMSKEKHGKTYRKSTELLLKTNRFL